MIPIYMKKLIAVVLTSGLLYACGSTQNGADTTSKESSETNMNDNDVVTYANTITKEELKASLYTYASDEFEGRETGEPGQKKAVNFLKEYY